MTNVTHTIKAKVQEDGEELKFMETGQMERTTKLKDEEMTPESKGEWAVARKVK